MSTALTASYLLAFKEPMLGHAIDSRDDRLRCPDVKGKKDFGQA